MKFCQDAITVILTAEFFIRVDFPVDILFFA